MHWRTVGYPIETKIWLEIFSDLLKRFKLSENEAEAIRLIEDGVDVHARDINGSNPINLAAEFSNWSKSERIFRNCSDFQWQIVADFENVVRLLIKKGYVDLINIGNNYGGTALHTAACNGNY